MFMKLIIIPEVHKVKFFMYAKKIMTKTTIRIFMMKNIGQTGSSIFFMKSMDNIKSYWKRCRVFTVMIKFESIFKWQIMMTRQVEE